MMHTFLLLHTLSTNAEITLVTSPFPGHHTAVNIVEKIKENLTAFSIDTKKVVGIVHDQASNM